MCAQMRESECERCCCFIYRASAIYTQLKDQFREACLWATAKITLHYGACLTPKHTHARTLSPICEVGLRLPSYLLCTYTHSNKTMWFSAHTVQPCIRSQRGGWGRGEGGGAWGWAHTDWLSVLHGVQQALTCSGINTVNQRQSIAIHLAIFFFFFTFHSHPLTLHAEQQPCEAIHK